MRFHYLLGTAALALLTHVAHAQQPVLPGAPGTPASAPTSVAPAAAPAPDAAPTPAPLADGLTLGHHYEVKLQSGLSFTGVLKAVSVTDLTFDAVGMGTLTVSRGTLLRLRDLDTPALAASPGDRRRPSYFDIGTGSRYFFGPSGRNLRRGEGVAQDVWVLLAGVNYGVTDNFSIGGYLSLVPGVAPQNQLLLLTPKLGFDVGNNWNLGVGTLYIRIPGSNSSNGSSNNDGIGAGVAYGVATHGTADNNVSVGLGYGYANSDIGSTPTIYLAGQTRVSRRISLMSENYIIAAHNPAFFGLYGLKLNWQRASLGIGSGYIGYVDNDYKQYGQYGQQYHSDDSYFFFGYIYPVYLDVSFRFGKPYRKAEPAY